jgi:hypothetical protein
VNEDTKQAVAELVDAVAEAADEVVRHKGIRRLSRLGFYSKGFLFIIIGAIALMVVAGVHGARMVDQRGALAALANEPYGRVVLIIFVVGAAAHGFWNILRGVVDIDNLGRHWFSIVKRCIAAMIGVFYFGLGVSAAEIVVAAKIDTANSHAEETFVSVLLMIPVFGALWAVVIGIGLVVAGFNEAYSGLSGRFRATYRRWRIEGLHGPVITALAVLSFSVRAVLLIVMGYFFIKAPFDSNPGPIGLDAALLTLLATAFGRTVVAVAGVGLVAHGVLAFYEARFRRLW